MLFLQEQVWTVPLSLRMVRGTTAELLCRHSRALLCITAVTYLNRFHAGRLNPQDVQIPSKVNIASFFNVC